jgi:hypothetical protein
MCMRTHPVVHPLFSSLDMCAPYPHTTSASVWVAVWRPRVAYLGGLVWWVLKRSLHWRYRRLQRESTKLLCELAFCGRGGDRSSLNHVVARE